MSTVAILAVVPSTTSTAPSAVFPHTPARMTYNVKCEVESCQTTLRGLASQGFEEFSEEVLKHLVEHGLKPAEAEQAFWRMWERYGGRLAEDLPPLTPRQAKAMRWIVGYLHRKGVSPTYVEVMRGIGYVSIGSAYALVERLMAKGYLRRTKMNQERAIQLTGLMPCPSCGSGRQEE